MVVVVARVARAAWCRVSVKLARTARGRRPTVAAETVLVVQLHRVVLEVALEVTTKTHAHLCSNNDDKRMSVHFRGTRTNHVSRLF